jgi:hypothetical protein
MCVRERTHSHDFHDSADEKLNSCLWKNLEEFALWVKDLGTYTSSFEKANNEPPRWKKICNVIGH